MVGRSQAPQEVEQEILRCLKERVREKGPRRKLEEYLGVYSGWLTARLRGRAELKVIEFLRVLQWLRMTPLEFFQALEEDDERADLEAEFERLEPEVAAILRREKKTMNRWADNDDYAGGTG